MLDTTALQPTPPTGEVELALDVAKSVTGRRWVRRVGDRDTARRIAEAVGAPELVGRLMVGRGVREEDARDFLQPTLRSLLPDPSSFIDMDAAAERLGKAVRAGETVAVFGDYDVDGACSGALMVRYLSDLGCATIPYVPDRMKEGYGPNAPALERLCNEGATLIVTVDCGIAAHAEIEAIAGRADVIILDHHKTEVAPPVCVAAVNPNRMDCPSGQGHICATTVAFLAAAATNRLLRREGFFTAERPEPKLLDLLDMVALATVADMMPLTGVNRALVAQGLKVLGTGRKPGLRALMDVAGQKIAPDAFTLGFKLGPRINAGGRIGDIPLLGTRLLLADDEAEAQAIAHQLDRINRERRTVESDIVDAAEEAAARQIEAGHAVILVCEAEWHPGVVGIVASRLKERFNRPALVGGLDEHGNVKGSGRSVPGLDLGAAIIAAKAAGLLTSGGGHAMAAGFGCKPSGTEAFHAFLDERLAAAANLTATPDILVDETTRVAAATMELIDQAETLAPYGNGNEEPVYAISNARIKWAKRVGKEGKTIQVGLEGQGGGRSLKAVCFKAQDGPLAETLLARAGEAAVHVCGKLRAETWNGEVYPCLEIMDVAIAG